VVHWWRRRDDPHWRRSLFFNATGGTLSAIVFLTAALTKFTMGAWVALLAIGLILLASLRIRRHYDLVAEATALHPHATEIPAQPLTPVVGDGDKRLRQEAGSRAREDTAAAETETSPRTEVRAKTVAETEEQPEEIRHLTIVPVAGLDLAACERSPTRRPSGSQCLPCTSAPLRMRPSAFATTGRHGAITFRWKCSSHPTAPSSHPWSITSGHCTASGPT
jgi:hypothetical protein